MTVVQVVVSTLLMPWMHRKGQPRKKLEDLEASLENGYICGNSIKDNNNGQLYVRRASRCGDYIESQYYNPSTGLKGGRILTPDMCNLL